MPTQPAILGTARLGNFRLGYEPAALVPVRSTQVRITLAGAVGRVRKDGFSIHDVINDNPNTCTLTVDDPAPTGGQTLRVTINADAPRLLFNGALQTVDLSYEGLPDQWAWPCTAIDDTALANRRRPFGTWTSVSATTVAQYIVTTFAPEFSTAGIALGLPLVSVNLDGSEGFSGAFQQLATLIGGYWKVEDLVAYLFITDLSDPPDAIDDTPGRLLDSPPITISTDNSQLETRVFGKGHGEALLSDIAIGETALPLANVQAWFNAAGGSAISLTQRLTYTGITQASPTTPPSIAPRVGAGIDNGAHQYAYTFVTAAGETLPSFLAAPLVMETLPASPAIVNVTAAATPGSGPAAGVTISYGVAVIKSISAFVVTGLTSGVSDLVTAAPVTAAGDTTYTLHVTALAAHVGRTLGFFRADTGGGGNTSYSLISYTVVLAAGPMALFQDSGTFNTTNNYGFYGPAAGWSGYGAVNQALPTVVPKGPAGTTQRKLYRTAAGGTQLKLQQTIANNTATVGVVDSTPDASLGANAPTTDTSGLVLNGVSTTSGATAAKSTTLNLVSGAAFLSAGGWGLVAGIPFRYTGKSTNQLTGIPASGPGSITAAIPAASTVTTLPTLLGIPASGAGSVVAPMNAGDLVNVWVQRDDLAAQAAMAAVDAANGITPADGIYEGPPIVDERRGEASLTALCDATLIMKSRPIVTVTYACRDVKTKSGKTVHIDVASPRIGPIDLTIQDVTITEVDVSVGTPPKFAVTASSVRWSLDALLRQLLAAT